MARMLARLGRVLLVAALLLAQHAAITHEIWHAAGAASAQGPQPPAGKSNKLCDLHDLLGTVLGAASGAAPTPAFLDVADTRYVGITPTPREAPSFASRSRGPPLTA